MIEQTFRFCSTKLGGQLNDAGALIPFVETTLEEMNESGWRAVHFAYNPKAENRVLILFEKAPKVKIEYNEVDI